MRMFGSSSVSRAPSEAAGAPAGEKPLQRRIQHGSHARAESSANARHREV
jgi:hypothetical protein